MFSEIKVVLIVFVLNFKCRAVYGMCLFIFPIRFIQFKFHHKGNVQILLFPLFILGFKRFNATGWQGHLRRCLQVIPPRVNLLHYCKNFFFYFLLLCSMVEFASYSDLKEAMKRFDGILLNSRQIKLVDVSDISGSPHLSSTQSRSRNSSDSLTEMPVSTPKSPSVRQRSYPTSKLSEEGRHLVVVSHTVNGPHKFAIQLTSEAEAYGKLRKAIESSLRPFPGIPKKGDPCIALCLTGKAFHRCLITAVDDSGPTYTVYFIDIGTECQISPDFIRDISNELLACPPFAYQVSLAGVEEVAQLIGLNDIFSSLLKSAGYLLAQVTKDKVHLYDHSGRNFIDVLTSIKLNLMATILGIATNGPSVASPSPPLTKEMVKYFFFYYLLFVICFN